jgi:hypothetical protein
MIPKILYPIATLFIVFGVICTFNSQITISGSLIIVGFLMYIALEQEYEIKLLLETIMVVAYILAIVGLFI